MIPDQVKHWCLQNGHGSIVASAPVSGGCINNGLILKTKSGATFFVKINQHAPSDMFAREAEGLAALAIPDGPQVPAPLIFGEQFILLEDLEPAERSRDYWIQFGHRLAALHNHMNSQFGFDHDNYIGSTPQPNPWTKNGYAFFSEHRLLFQAKLAVRQGLLDNENARKVRDLAARLPQLVPDQPASLIHGDLWGGNAMTDERGSPVIIDPAAHYGWAEAELAMTTLFGSFPEKFYSAYQEVRPLAPGYQGRFPLYNLYHLLNHLNLFGRAYLSRVLGILHRFA
ncbi:MAG: fructosamine kinase family protein [Anaerolineales bacterium]|jgi:protein-ribulosamine 3-kinase